MAQRTAQYLPLHHSAHSKAHLIALKAKQDGSKAGETVFHSNMERLINKVFGIEVNSRHTLSAQQCATVSMAYAIYDECSGYVLANDLPANDAYGLAKLRIEQLAAMMSIKQVGVA